MRPTCHLGELQRVAYNGHKCVHAVKFQYVALPNGMIANMFWPVGKKYFSNSPQLIIRRFFGFYIVFNDKYRRFGVFMTPLSRRSKITEFAARCNKLAYSV